MSKVTAKYQITIPPEVRKTMKIIPGIEVDIREENGRFYLVKSSARSPISKWKGALKVKKSVDEIIKDLRGQDEDIT